MPGTVNSPLHNDNRNYDYSGFPEEERKEYALIAALIQPNTTVVDLGCGNGSLMKLLQVQKSCTCTGVEIAPTGVQAANGKGFHVIQANIDQPLPFTEDQFDYAVCNVTIQMVMYPEILLKEMKRIAKYQIVSFPNFAFYRNRLDLLLKGRMPNPMLFSYTWYSTGHIHQLSIADFLELVHSTKELKVKTLETVSSGSRIKDSIASHCPNLFMLLPVFLLEKVTE